MNTEKELDPKYFSTPGTSFQGQRQIANFNDFDICSDAYRRLTTRIVIRTYALKQA